MTEPEWQGSTWPGARPLRCQWCGEQIGVICGEDMPDAYEASCYGCAATREAEAITKDSLAGGGDD